MERERWRGAQFLGWVGLLTGAKTTVAGGGGIEPWDLQTVPGGDKNVKQGATALPWQVLGRLSHALSSTRSSLVPRTEPGSNVRSFLRLAPQQLFISTASQPICRWLRLSAVLETEGGKLASLLFPMVLATTAKQHMEDWDVQTRLRV